jgi:hypothetical protein
MQSIEGNRVQHEAFDRFERELEEYAISERERVLLRWAYQQGFNAANAVQAATPQQPAPAEGE